MWFPLGHVSDYVFSARRALSGTAALWLGNAWVLRRPGSARRAVVHVVPHFGARSRTALIPDSYMFSER